VVGPDAAVEDVDRDARAVVRVAVAPVEREPRLVDAVEPPRRAVCTPSAWTTRSASTRSTSGSPRSAAAALSVSVAAKPVSTRAYDLPHDPATRGELGLGHGAHAGRGEAGRHAVRRVAQDHHVLAGDDAAGRGGA
jgi:hypothetical protein